MTPVLARARFAAVALLLTTATAAFADPNVPALRPAPWKPPACRLRAPAVPAGVAGMIVALDPETGAIGLPTARRTRRSCAPRRTC